MKEFILRNIVRMKQAYNAPLNIILSNNKRIKQYKGKYRGERCFIVGNGPSLTKEDLDLLKGEYTFAANKIYYMFKKTEWRPTFYCSQDLVVLNEIEKEFLNVSTCAKATFLRMQGFSNIRNWYQKIPNLVWIPIWERFSNGDKIYFSSRADRFIYDGWTVTYMAMQLAVYMGFTKIYLIGVDHSFPFEYLKNGKIRKVDMNIAAHFYESASDNIKENVIQPLHRANLLEFVSAAYKTAEEISRKTKKFRIYNATRGGKLETFERVKLEEILG